MILVPGGGEKNANDPALEVCVVLGRWRGWFAGIGRYVNDKVYGVR